MRINLLLFCCTLLATCQPPLDPPSDSKASSNSSSASSPIIENNVDLRMLFTRMRTNCGLLFDEKGLGYSFQGEAYETTKGEGFLTNGDQGIFSFQKDPVTSDIQLSEYIGPGKVSQKRGLLRMAKGSENLFISEESSPNIYFPRSYSKNPFVEECLQLYTPALSLEDIDHFSITILSNQSMDVRYEIRGDDGDMEGKTIHFSRLGDIYDEKIKAYLDHPVMVEPPTQFSFRLQSEVEKIIGTSSMLPFPNGVTHAFYDRTIDANHWEWAAYQSALESTYSLQLLNSGFVLQSSGLSYQKKVSHNDTLYLLNVCVQEKEGWTIAAISIEHPKEWASSFGYINSLLGDSPYPIFPPCITLLEATIQKTSDTNFHIEAIFITEEAGSDYFENNYAENAKEKGFTRQHLCYEESKFIEFLRSDVYSIFICVGQSDPLKGFPFGMDLQKR
ncbi:MAG: hypothetical protein SPH43_04415 [Candidatus Enteromonas sp.]|nr:hypothetical protein [Candidatus Enteromonas sp.]